MDSLLLETSPSMKLNPRLITRSAAKTNLEPRRLKRSSQLLAEAKTSTKCHQNVSGFLGNP